MRKKLMYLGITVGLYLACVDTLVASGAELNSDLNSESDSYSNPNSNSDSDNDISIEQIEAELETIVENSKIETKRKDFSELIKLELEELTNYFNQHKKVFDTAVEGIEACENAAELSELDTKLELEVEVKKIRSFNQTKLQKNSLALKIYNALKDRYEKVCIDTSEAIAYKLLHDSNNISRDNKLELLKKISCFAPELKEETLKNMINLTYKLMPGKDIPLTELSKESKSDLEIIYSELSVKTLEDIKAYPEKYSNKIHALGRLEKFAKGLKENPNSEEANKINIFITKIEEFIDDILYKLSCALIHKIKKDHPNLFPAPNTTKTN